MIRIKEYKNLDANLLEKKIIETRSYIPEKPEHTGCENNIFIENKNGKYNQIYYKQIQCRQPGAPTILPCLEWLQDLQRSWYRQGLSQPKLKRTTNPSIPILNWKTISRPIVKKFKVRKKMEIFKLKLCIFNLLHNLWFLKGHQQNGQ